MKKQRNFTKAEARKRMNRPDKIEASDRGHRKIMALMARVGA